MTSADFYLRKYNFLNLLSNCMELSGEWLFAKFRYYNNRSCRIKIFSATASFLYRTKRLFRCSSHLGRVGRNQNVKLGYKSGSSVCNWPFL